MNALSQSYRLRVGRIDKGFADLKKIIGEGEEAKTLVQAQDILTATQKKLEEGINLQREINNSKSLNDLVALVAADKGQTLSRLRNLAKDFVEKQQSLPNSFPSEAARPNAEGQGAGTPTGNSSTIHLQAMEIYTAVLEMEDTERGYLLVGTDEFLRSYEEASKRAFALIEKQKQTMAGNIAQLRLLGDIEDSLKKWVKEIAEPEIAMRKQVSAAKTMADFRQVHLPKRVSKTERINSTRCWQPSKKGRKKS